MVRQRGVDGELREIPRVEADERIGNKVEALRIPEAGPYLEIPIILKNQRLYLRKKGSNSGGVTI